MPWKEKAVRRSTYLCFCLHPQDGSYSRGPLDLLNNVQIDDVDPDSVADDDPQRRKYNFNPASVIEQVGRLIIHSQMTVPRITRSVVFVKFDFQPRPSQACACEAALLLIQTQDFQTPFRLCDGQERKSKTQCALQIS